VTGKQGVGCMAGESFGSIDNCYVTGEVTGSGNFVGGLTGQNASGSSITNSYSSATVSASSLYVGGLTGTNDGGTISGSFAAGNVTVTGEVRYIGGLTGYNRDADIINSYAIGDVTADSGIYVGGLVGENLRGSITGSYAFGNASGRAAVGGLVGYMYDSTSFISDSYAAGNVNGGNGSAGGLIGDNYYGQVTNCYSIGTVSSNSSLRGGLAGFSPDGTITNCYFLETAGPDNGYGDPLSSEEMKQQANFVGWDFTTTPIWKMLRETETYPRLEWQRIHGGDSNGDGAVNLEDLVITLQLVTGGTTKTIYTEADVDGDEQLGLPETLHILKTLGE